MKMIWWKWLLAAAAVGLAIVVAASFHVTQRVIWLHDIFSAFSLVGISAAGNKNVLPDEVILDQWTAHMAAERTAALESPEEFGREHDGIVWF